MAMRKQIKRIAKRLPGLKRAYTMCLAVPNGIRKLAFYLQGGTRHEQKGYNAFFVETLGKRNPRTDVVDHLGAIFWFATDAAPKLMVELGTRGGESTRALLAAASVTQSTLLSVDIEDCKHIDLPSRQRWHFVKSDDIEFGETGFKPWCLAHSVAPIIDVLFIDSSHEYEHTKRELEVWGEYLSANGMIICHDTNMGTGMYSRMDGSIGVGWDNQRGVIRAIEEFVGRQYDENACWCDVTDKYSLIHFPTCSGLTIIKKRKERISD